MAREDLEVAAEGERASVVFFDEDVAEVEFAGDFVTDEDTAEGGGDYGVGREVRDEGSECGANALGNLRVLEEEGALKELAAVEAGAEDEMTVEECAGLAEEGEEFVGLH